MRVFNFFVNQEVHNSFKTFVWRLEEDYLLRLGGLQLKVDKDDRLSMNPVYYPLFTWSNKPDRRELTIYIGQISYMFIQSGWSLSILKGSDIDIDGR